MAAKSVGAVAIDLQTNVVQFTGDMTRAAKAVSSTNAKVNKSLGAMQNKFGLLGKRIGKTTDSIFGMRSAMGALSAMISTYAVKQSLDFADAIGKTADAANISTAKLQELRHAGDLYGASTRDIDDAVKRFNRRLGLFLQDGGGPAAKAFEDLGLRVRDASGEVRSTEAVLDDAIGLLSQYSDKAVIAATASQLFGEDAGPRLANLIAAGSKEINNLANQAQRLGLVMDDDIIRSAEKAKDKISILSSVMTTKFNVAIATNAEHIGRLADASLQAVTSLTKFMGVVVDLKNVFQEDGLNASLKSFTEGFLTLLGATEKTDTKKVGEVTQEFQGLVDMFNTPVQVQGQQTINDILQKRAEVLKMLGGKNEGTETVEKSIVTVKKMSEETEKRMDEIQRASENAMENVGDGLIRTAQTGKLEFKDMVNSIEADLSRLIIKQSIINPLVDTFGGYLSQGIGSLFSGGAAEAAAGASTSASTASLPGRAIGGGVNHGQPYVVGERGPEVFVPNQSGTIIPNGKGGGGVTVNQSINISTGVAQTVQSELRKFMPEIQRITVAGVSKAINKGGPMARQVGAKK